MPPSKEGHDGHGRPIRHRHSPIEEACVNTARPDLERVDSATQLVNNILEPPTPDADFQLPDSPGLQRLMHTKHEENHEALSAEQSVPIFQRPKSSGSAPQHNGFAFGARQQKTLHFKIERPPPMIGRESPPEQTSQDNQVPDPVHEDQFAVRHNDRQSPPHIDPPSKVQQTVIDVSAGNTMDLTRASPFETAHKEHEGLTASDTKPIRSDQATESASELPHGEQEQHVRQDNIAVVEDHTPCTPQRVPRCITERPFKVVKPPIKSRSAHAPADLHNSIDVIVAERLDTSNRPAASPSGGGPSEEDLFYLLMHRQRQRKDVETRLMARYKELEDANAQLSQQNRQYKSQLDAGRARQDKHSSELSSQKTALEDFKARFSKLKNFVNGLGSDYKGLREDADKIKSSQQALSKDKEDVDRKLQAMRRASAAAEHSLRSISSQLGNVRAGVTPLEQSLHDTEETLRIERGLLSKEQRRTQRLETYLIKVATTQNRFSVALQDEQKGMLEQLRLITRMIVAIQDATSVEPQSIQLPGLAEGLRMVRVPHESDRLVPADITKVAEAVTTLSHNLNSHQKSSLEAVQAGGGSNVNLGNQLATHTTTLLESFHATPVQEQQFNDLREEKVRLEEQLRSSGELMREIREGKTAAEARETHLRKTADSLMGEMNELRNKSMIMQKIPPPIDERQMISTWQLKYNAAHELLTVAEDRVSLRENEVRKREETIETLKGQLQEIEAERDAAIQSLKETEESQSTNEHTSGVLEQKLTEHERCLDDLRREMQSSEEKHSEEVEQLKREIGSQKELQGELDAVKSERDTAIGKYVKLRKEVQDLQEKLKGPKRVREQAAKVPQLTKDLQEKQAEIAKLSQQVAGHEELLERVSELEQVVTGKSKDVESLQNELAGAKKSAKEIAALQEDIETTGKEMEELKDKLQCAQNESKSKAEVEQALAKLKKEREDLQTKLTNAKTVAEQVPGLRRQVEERSKTIKELENNLNAANKTTEEVQGLKEANSGKDVEIAALLERLGTAEQGLKALQVLEGEDHSKIQELASLKKKLSSAEGDLERIQGLESANNRKDQELASLRKRLRSSENASQQLTTVKENNQPKDAEIASLQERSIEKFEQTSQQAPKSRTTTTSQIDEPSQGMMLALQCFTTPEDADFVPGTNLHEPLASEKTSQLRRKANRNGNVVTQQTTLTTTVETSLLGTQMGPLSQTMSYEDVGHPKLITDSGFAETQETTFIPESHVTGDSQGKATLVTTGGRASVSSPLSSLEDLLDSSDPPCDQSAYFALGAAFEEHESAAAVISRNNTKFTNPGISLAAIQKIPVNFESDAADSRRSQKESPSSRPPSSSYGEPMLLEHLEEIENQNQSPGSDFMELSLPQDPPISPGLPFNSKTGNETTRVQVIVQSRKEKAKHKANAGPSSKKPSPRRLRSESRTRPKKSTVSTERAPTDQNIPATPRTGILKEKHLPNSAAKRRLEIDDSSTVSSSYDDSKRLKRDLSALEVKMPGNKKTSVVGQMIPSKSTGRLNHPSLPTGGRKASVIGTNAPVPETAGQQAPKKSRKPSKGDQYSARFSKESK